MTSPAVEQTYRWALKSLVGGLAEGASLRRDLSSTANSLGTALAQSWGTGRAGASGREACNQN